MSLSVPFAGTIPRVADVNSANLFVDLHYSTGHGTTQKTDEVKHKRRTRVFINNIIFEY